MFTTIRFRLGAAAAAIAGVLALANLVPDAASLASDLGPASPSATPTPGGSRGDLGLGTQLSYDPADADLDRVRDSGFAWLRTVVLTSWLGASESRDYAKLDRLLNQLSQRGLAGVLVLFGDPAKPPVTPGERADFARRAADIAKRCGDRNVIFEIWNEPNSSRFWGPNPDPASYAALAIETAKAIKAVSQRPVLAMSTSKIDTEFIVKAARAQPDLLAALDGVSIHPYVLGPPEANLAAYDKLSATLRTLTRGGPVPPLYCTEYGFFTGRAAGSVPEPIQAAYLVRGYLVNQIKRLPVSIAYCLGDIGADALDPEHNFGLVCQNGRRKTSHQAMTKLAREIEGCRFVDRWKGADPDVFIVRFQRPDGGWTLAIWTVSEDAKRVRLPITIPNGQDPKIGPAERELQPIAGANFVAVTPAPTPRWLRLPAVAVFRDPQRDPGANAKPGGNAKTGAARSDRKR